MIKAALLRLRTRSPKALRQLYRIVRSFEPVQSSRDLPPDLVQDCRFVAGRSYLLDVLPRGGRVAEMGTYRGDFAREILQRNEPAELHVIDIDYSLFDSRLLADKRIKAHRGWTHEVIATFPNDHFDWIYIDAEHSYDAVLRDARASAVKVKPGGFLVFNDFTHIDQFLGRYGVHRAVVDFMLETRWPLRFFAYASHALYDVALGKPMI